MDLTTRCPQCGTTFSASLEQLQLRKGYIRCINCAHIFDGFEAVVSPGDARADDRAVKPQKAVEPRVSMPSVLRQRQGADEQAHTISPVPAQRDDGFRISSGAQATRTDQDPVFHVGDRGLQARPDPVLSSADAGPAAGSRATPGREIYIEPRHTDRRGGEAPVRTFEFMTEASPGLSVWRLLWRTLALLGLVLVLAQLVYVYRVQIANNVPVLRPMLERACASLDCQVPYARRIDQITIMSSSLRSGPEARGGVQAEKADKEAETNVMLLQVTLRNTYDQPQEWPTLVLDLTDFSGTMVVRKNLPPQSYLPASALAQPFQAGGEITASVPIVMNGVKVNGYQLDKFFQ